MKPQNYTIHRFAKNTLGLNTRDTLAGMDPNASSDLLNVEFDTKGAIRKRRGYEAINTRVTEDTCVGLAQFGTTSGSTFAVSVFDDAIYKMDEFDGTWDVITGAVSLTTDQDYHVSIAVGADTVVGTNGVDVPWKWTGTGNAADLSISQFTTAKKVVYYKNRLVFANMEESATAYPNRVRWSRAGTIETFDAVDYSDQAETNDNSEIVGMVKFFDDIYIFKNSYGSGIKKLYYTGEAVAPFGMVNIGEVGAISGDSIVYADIPGVGSGLVYWGIDNKIRFFDGNKSVDIADHVQSTLDGTNRSRAKYIQAVNYPDLNQIWFSVSWGSSTTHDKIIVYDYHNRAILVHDNITANKMAILEDTSDVKYLVTGNYAGVTHKQNTGNNDSGTSFHSYYWTAWLDLGEPAFAKKFRWLDLYVAEVGEYNLSLGYNFDFSSSVKKSKAISLAVGSASFGTAIFGQDVFGGESVVIKRVPLFGTNKNRYIRFKFSNDIKDQPYTIYRFDVIAKFLNLKDI